MSESVEHFVQGGDAWRTGLVGLLPRKRTLLLTSVLTLATMGVPWWWQWLVSPLPAVLTLPTKFAVPLGAFLVGCGLAAILFLVRRDWLRFIKAAHQLHGLSHDLRDAQTRLMAAALDGRNSGREYRDLPAFAEKCCERVKDLFVELTRSASIEAAIRIAAVDENAEVVYRTIGRSNGLNSKRAETSSDLPSNKGVARFLADEHGCRGVLLYRDLQAASKLGAYQLTKNDELYSSEIRTMLVAPMNAWDGEQQRMIGILYVCSSGTASFNGNHVDYMGFAADVLAASLCQIVEFMHEEAVLPGEAV